MLGENPDEGRQKKRAGGRENVVSRGRWKKVEVLSKASG